MDSKIEPLISLLDMHAGLTEFQSKQLLQMAARIDFQQGVGACQIVTGRSSKARRDGPGYLR
jgi:hypothetical protein